jgi:hypothetical protein
MALTNYGVIGVQGSPTGSASLNQWELNCAAWGISIFAPNQTYCENSDPTQSFLWVRPQSSDNPNNNNWYTMGTGGPYQMGNSTSIGIGGWGEPTCNNWSQWVPAWRSSNSNTVTALLEGKLTTDEIKLYPNPSNSVLNIDNLSTNQNVNICIIDFTGKIFRSHYVRASESLQLNVSDLAQGLYLVEIKSDEGATVHKKFIKSN